jgi:hypothetical protein
MQHRHGADHRHLIVVDAERREGGLCLVRGDSELLEGATATYPLEAVFDRLDGASAIDDHIPAA